MKERPILFKGEMVRAIQAGHKTQTRRLVTKATSLAGVPWGWLDFEDAFADPGIGSGAYLKTIYRHPEDPPDDATRDRVRCRIAVGDRLWVRETHQIESNRGAVYEHDPPFSDGRPVKWTDSDDWGRYWSQCHYRATEPTHDLIDPAAGGEPGDLGWRPSIFMPRWACRILLVVKAVRVERLQEISEGDALAEGVAPDYSTTPREAFAALWESINAKRAPWSSDPWLWVVEFGVVK